MTDALPQVRRLGITGTDTGIGKTVVSCALAARARQLGMRVAAMKPAESGIDERPVSESGLLSDADRLRAATCTRCRWSVPTSCANRWRPWWQPGAPA
jgi:dethiobiotin synthetase